MITIECQDFKNQIYQIFLNMRKIRSFTFVILVPVREYILEVTNFFSKRKIPVFRVKEDRIDINKVGVFIVENISSAINIPTFVVLSNHMEEKEIDRLNRLYNSNLYFLKSIEVVEQHVIPTFDFTKYPKHLQNEKIKETFLMAFEIVDTELDIISPWMNFYVVNDTLVSKMEQLLGRGVKIYIRYGMNEENEGYDKARLIKSRQVANMLKTRFSPYKGKEWRLLSKGVKMTTLHSAKGLEFDVVIIPFLEDSIIPRIELNKKNEKQEQEILEKERSLLYVGMTRARNELFMMYAGEKSRFIDEFKKEYFEMV